MKTLKQIELEEKKLREIRNVLQEKQRIEVFNPELKKYVGRCFVYRNNSYGGKVKKSDYWDVFKRVVDFTLDKNQLLEFIIEEFEVTSAGEVNIKIYKHYPYPDGRHPFDLEEITYEEFDAERDKMIKEFHSQKKIRKEKD